MGSCMVEFSWCLPSKFIVDVSLKVLGICIWYMYYIFVYGTDLLCKKEKIFLHIACFFYVQNVNCHLHLVIFVLSA